MKAFFDTSAIAKRYINEKGSETVNDIVFKSKNVVISILCLPEIFSALNRLKREKAIDAAQYTKIKDIVIRDFKTFEVCSITPSVVGQAITLLEHHALKSMDALQIACAISIKPQIFISSDIKQIAVAQNWKLKVVQV